jgi:rhodanese-related sulfurtransferase
MDTISAKDLDWYVQDGTFLIIDLRPREDYSRSHIRGAINVPYGEFYSELKGYRGTVVLYCERGSLSMAVARELERQGFRTKSVVGGIRAYRGKYLVS